VERGLNAGSFVAACDVRSDIHQAWPNHSRVLPIRGDVSREDDVVRAINLINEKWNRLDVLVNNAGIVGSGRVETESLDEWLTVMNSNLTSVFLCCKHAIPLLRQSRGCIVSMSSTNGLTGGSPLSGPAYAAAKAGIIALTKNMARDLASDGVRVNAIAAGPIDTLMLDRLGDEGKQSLIESIPLGEISTAEDVANLVFFLASSAARHITGVTISHSGGLVMS
jgi:NAD(P)-dependent dehydrogenase (short-subunit alcohol dehydrogenase family)